MGDQIAIENCLNILSQNQSSLIDEGGKILEPYHKVRVVHYKNLIYSNLQFGLGDDSEDESLINDAPSVLCWVNRTDSYRVMQLTAPVAEDKLQTIDYVVFDPEVLRKELKKLLKNSELLDDAVERIYYLRHGAWNLDRR